jgi:hypothetical protein
MSRALRSLTAQLSALSAELRDQAFALDTRGRHDAADLAATLARRLEELHADGAPSRPRDRDAGGAGRRRRLASAARSARPARA